MSDLTVRKLAKAILPGTIRRFLGACVHYVERVGRWPIILWQVRGVTWQDQWVLLNSALVAPILSLDKLLDWQDPILLADAQVVVKGIGRFKIRARTDDLYHVFPDREPSVLGAIREYLKPGDVFVDAGANIGVYTVLAGRLVGDSGRVIAIEMVPKTAKILSDHVAMNLLANVVLIDRAIGEAAGQHVIARVPAGKYGQASIVDGIAIGGDEVRVTTSTLADTFSDIDHITLMKMDLEGAEGRALEGARESLRRVQAVIFEDWGDERLSEIFRLQGFSVERLDGNNCLAKNGIAT